MELIQIQQRIYQIRGEQVMLDFDLAEMFELETRALKQAVRRNIERFPRDFKFSLTKKGMQGFGITICDTRCPEIWRRESLRLHRAWRHYVGKHPAF